MFSFLKPRKVIVTHNGKYHADEVFACATLQLVLQKRGYRTKIIRSRDQKIIDSADYVCDVGAIYNPETNRFDHHQEEGAGKRENGIPYATFGLVWKHYGKELIDSDKFVEYIDKVLVQDIDAHDNGVLTFAANFPDVVPYDIRHVLNIFTPSWKETFSIDAAFFNAVDFAKMILSREILKKKDREDLTRYAEEYYQRAIDKRVIVFDRFCPWKDVISSHPEPLYVVTPDEKNNVWTVMTVRDDWNSFISRKDLPKSWSGLRDAEFAEVSGVADALYCHRGIWLATAKSKEGAVALAQKALDA